MDTTKHIMEVLEIIAHRRIQLGKAVKSQKNLLTRNPY